MSLTCCSKCSWKGWGLPVVCLSDCLLWLPCCSCCSPPQRWWPSRLRHTKTAENKKGSVFSYTKVDPKWKLCSNSLKLQQKSKIQPLKHWIHFRRSSLWPPTSNILRKHRKIKNQCFLTRKLENVTSYLLEVNFVYLKSRLKDPRCQHSASQEVLKQRSTDREQTVNKELTKDNRMKPSFQELFTACYYSNITP